MDKIRELLDQIGQLEDEARALNESAETEARDLTTEEQTRWNDIMDEETGEIAKLNARVERARQLQSMPATRSTQPVKPQQAPAVIQQRGDNFAKNMRAWLMGDNPEELRSMMVSEKEINFRASNATDMNITTAADGGNIVPVGFYNEIVAKRTEMSLPRMVGCRLIPGVGTTVDVPYDNETDGEFVSTAEAGSFDLDAPALGQAQLTLVKYSKYIKLSVELLNDEDAALMAFLSDWVARGQAKTYNSLLLTEIASNGTSLKTTASATAVAAGEPEGVVGNDNLAYFLEDDAGGTINWIMRPSTFWAFGAITGSPRLYAEDPSGSRPRRQLVGYPVYFSGKAGALTASQKSAYFGNWYYVGYREGPGFTLLRDPYSAASTGQVVLWMYFRTVFKVLQPTAVGYLIQHA